jgi:predicted nucleotidyltransferase component of viral defense system
MPFPKTPQGLAQRLQRIASEQGKSYQELLTSFLIERALLRMVSDKFLYNHLVFKGGYVGQRIFETGRFTRDLDSILLGASMVPALEAVKNCLIRDLEDHTWFEFEDQSNLELQKEYGGVRLKFRAGLLPKLKDLKRAQILHLDFGVGDPVTPAPLTASTQTTVGDDLISWQVYTVETICAEKLHTLVTRGSENSRSKDVFDLAILLPKANSQVFKDAIVRTFDYRGDPVPKFMVNALREIDTTLLQRGWKSALAGMKTIPEFDETFDAVVERLVAHGF